MRRSLEVNDYIKRLGILLVVIGAIYVLMSTTCPLVPCHDLNPETGELFIRMCPVQACAHGYIYAGLTLWLIGAVLWIGGTFLTPDVVVKYLYSRKSWYKERREKGVDRSIMEITEEIAQKPVKKTAKRKISKKKAPAKKTVKARKTVKKTRTAKKK